MKPNVLLLSLSLIAGVASAAPQLADEYIGFSGAFAHHNVSYPSYNSNEDNRVGYALTAGYYVLPQLSLELAFADLGDSDGKDFNGKVSTSIRSVSFSALGHLPVTEQFGVYGRLGAGQLRARGDYGFGSYTTHDYQPVVGIGVEGTISNEWRLFAELTHYGKVTLENQNGDSMGSVKAMALQAGASYHF
ncbi:outer membrane beta-barrel protein [Craterilacuibacter sp. RT1T]|uniref:outer membrane beta-barrel protein n=1 Tax=Craterilacuibacter sp. RT1T TaxID=2942211 RepID=UPI0020BEF204|nr:outer membrane beta-barrel protein [Craterilacuibacter sp. RT1T]MCL6264091.1 porin family protein [Craterilacuibacter sp. RT1T]